MLGRAREIGDEIVEALRAHPAAVRVELAGSARRWADSVKDLDVVAASDDPAALIEAFKGLEQIEAVASSGEAGARARTHSGMAVDLKVVAPDQFGNLLQHFTGSKRHNVQLREAAVKRGLHVSEYGILDDVTGETLRCATEQEVYAALGYAYVEPELREGRGELAAALDGGGGLPRLITLEDLKGELHCHTTASDGKAEIEDMAYAALELGLRVPRDHRPLRHARLRRRGLARASWRSRSSGSTPPTSRSTGSSCSPAARSTSSRRRARLRRRAARESSTGRSRASTPRSGWTSAR